MITQFINLLLQRSWNRAADSRARAVERAAAKIARNAAPGLAQNNDAVLLGDTIPSALQALRQGGRAESVPVTLTAEERARHVYILGKTGSGKTVLQLALFLSDVRAKRAVVLIDARGDLLNKCLLHLAAEQDAASLAERLVILDFRENAPYKSAGEAILGFNPLTETGNDPYMAAGFIMEVLRQQWGDAALGVQIQETLRNALFALACAGETLLALEPLLTMPAYRARVLRNLDDASALRFFERFEALGPAQMQWVNPVLNKLNWASRPNLRRILGQSGGVSFWRLFEERRDSIVLVCLGQDELFRAASGVLGTLVVAAIKSAVMRSDRPLTQRTPVSLILDEAQHVAEAAPDLLSEIITEGRRFGLSLTLSHQSPAQIEDRKLKGVLRNVIATTLLFAVGGGDADTLAGELPSEEPKAVLRNLLISQKVGDCLAVRQGQPLTRLHTRFTPDPDLPAAQVAVLRGNALRHYGKSPAETDAELAAQERRYAAPVASPLSTPETATEREDAVVVRDAEEDPVRPRRKKRGTL